MSLWEYMQKECVMQKQTSAPDGEGGQCSARADGERFLAAIVKESSFEARIAEKTTGKASYKVTSSRSFDYHDIFRRVSDGQLFRVTSKAVDSSPPQCASFCFKQVSAEVFEDD